MKLNPRSGLREPRSIDTRYVLDQCLPHERLETSLSTGDRTSAPTHGGWTSDTVFGVEVPSVDLYHVNQAAGALAVFSQLAKGFACIVTRSSTIFSLFGRYFLSTSTLSIFSIVPFSSAPSMTRPKTVFLPSRWGASLNVMKNWLPFVCGPLFAIDTIPRPLCLSAGILISSSKYSPHIDVPPLTMGLSAVF